jgi:hypothetical protein
MLEIYLTLKNQMKQALVGSKTNDNHLIVSNIPLLLNFEKIQGTNEFENLIEEELETLNKVKLILS